VIGASSVRLPAGACDRDCAERVARGGWRQGRWSWGYGAPHLGGRGAGRCGRRPIRRL